MARANLTKRTVDAARPAARDVFLWDETLAGFGLKVTPKGRKSYVFQYRIAEPGRAARTAARRYTIGTHGKLTPDQARSRAKELAALVERGIDPREQEREQRERKAQSKRAAAEQARQEQELAFDHMAALWLSDYELVQGRRPSSIAMARLVVKNHLQPALGALPLPRIERSHLQALIDAIPPEQKAMRRSVFAYASVFFSWAMKRGDVPDNPLRTMQKPPPPNPRERVLTDTELARVWHAAEVLHNPFRAFFRLLILTGQRRSEVAGIAWDELDCNSATWSIPSHRAKNRTTHIVPLSPLAIAELDILAGGISWPETGLALTTTGRTPVSGISKARRRLDVAITNGTESLPPWRIHDLRRTLATGLQRLGVRFEVTEAILNHVSGARSGVAGIYQRYSWQDEKRVALNAWARHLETIINPDGRSNVVMLHRAGNG